MAQRLIVIFLGIVALSVIGFFTYFNKPALAPSRPTENNLHPLEIEAIRTRSYHPSAILTEQNLGDRGGYSDSIVSFESDGLKQYALLSVPNSPRPSSGYPVLIFNHGYINPETYQTDGADYKTIIAHYARSGMVVIKPDYRGHGRSEGTADGGHYSPVYTYDILNLIESLKKFDVVDNKRIATMGHSLGGHVSLRVAVASRDVKATILAAGVVGSFEDLFYHWPRVPGRSDIPRGAVRSNLENLILEKGDPRSNPKFWNSASAINYVKYIVGRIQIHHGEADESVPIVFSQKLKAALQSEKKHVEYFGYPAGDHQFTGAARQPLLDRSSDFLKTHL